MWSGMTIQANDKTPGRRLPRTKRRSHSSERLVFIDLETAGQQSWRPITQVGAVVADSAGQILETFEAKLQFRESQATKRALLRRHYDRNLWHREALPSRDVIFKFRDFLLRHATLSGENTRGQAFWLARIVAHNAAFDGPFLCKWFDEHGLYFPADYRIFCTLQRAFWLFQEYPRLRPPTDFKLKTLCDYFGIWFPASEAHDALADARATFELYHCLNHVEMMQSGRRVCELNVVPARRPVDNF